MGSAQNDISQADLVSIAILGCNYLDHLAAGTHVGLLVRNSYGVPVRCTLCGRQWDDVCDYLIDIEH